VFPLFGLFSAEGEGPHFELLTFIRLSSNNKFLCYIYYVEKHFLTFFPPENN
jgi:hypothetical protein